MATIRKAEDVRNLIGIEMQAEAELGENNA